MVNGFSKIQLHVPNLEEALEEYETWIGPFGRDGRTAYRALANVGIELVEKPDVAAPAIAGLTLWSAGGGDLPSDTRGLPLSMSRHRETAADLISGIQGVDHLVLRTADADDCIRLFQRDLGIRLALDQTVPEWGGRMVFFRGGKLTLEVIQTEERPPQDLFWGITYSVSDLSATLKKLDDSGVAHSGERTGRKPGTLVATVKSHCLGLPTLLIQPAAR